MRFKIIVLSIICATTCQSAFALTGGVSDGGGDNVTWENKSAWFLGTAKTINVCVDLSDNFNLSKSQAIASIQTAFLAWKEYLAKKHLFLDPVGLRFGPTTNLAFLDTCGPAADLVFYFGVETPEVRSAKKRFLNPTALAIRTSFSEAKGWGKGFIWISNPNSIRTGTENHLNYPNWTAPNNLLTILIHEVGHVLGSQHVDGTIMRADIVSLLNSSDYYANSKIQIDQAQELIRCNDCSYNLTTLWDVHDKPRSASILTSIFGEKPDDSIGSTKSSALVLKLKWNEDQLTFLMRKKDRSLASRIIITSRQFTTLSQDVLRTTIDWREHQNAILYGYAETPTKTKISVVIEYNVGDSPVTVSAFIDGTKATLARFADFEIESKP